MTNKHWDSSVTLTHLSIVALQIKDIVKRGDRIDLNDVSIDSCKHVATIAKSTLKSEGDKDRVQAQKFWVENVIMLHFKMNYQISQ